MDVQTLVEKAMAKHRDDRYASADLFAQDLRRASSGYPILANRLSLLVRAWRWSEKRRNLLVAAATVVFMATLGLAISLILINEQRSVAETNFKTAALNLKEAWAAVDDLSNTSDELAAVPGAEQVRQQILRKALAYYERLSRKRADESIRQSDLALTYSRIGALTKELDSAEAAIEYFVQAQQLYDGIDSRGADLVELDEVRRQQAENLNALGLAYTTIGRTSEAARVYEATLSIQTEALGLVSDKREYRVDLGQTKNNYGLLLRKSGEDAKAEALFMEAITLLATACEEDPNDIRARRLLGAALNNLGSIQIDRAPLQAQWTLREAIKVQLPMSTSGKYGLKASLDVVASYISLGSAYSKVEDWVAAEDANRHAAEMSRRLVNAAPNFSLYRQDLAVSLNNLGLSLRSQNKLNAAMEAFRESIDLQTSRVNEDPKNALLASNLGSTLNNLAMISRAQNELENASGEFRRAVTMQKRSLELEPKNASYRENLGKTLANLSQLLRQLRGTDAELETFRQRQELWKNDPENLQSIAEEVANLVYRNPQLVDELGVTLRLCQAAGVNVGDLMKRPAFQLLQPSLRDHLK
jgi:tetratricopeptide (TPR) repeat protein